MAEQVQTAAILSVCVQPACTPVLTLVAVLQTEKAFQKQLGVNIG